MKFIKFVICTHPLGGYAVVTVPSSVDSSAVQAASTDQGYMFLGDAIREAYTRDRTIEVDVTDEVAEFMIRDDALPEDDWN